MNPSMKSPSSASEGDIGYLPRERAFRSYTPDWTKSNASFLYLIIYQASLDGKLNPLHEVLSFTLADSIDKVLPSIPNPVSPYRGKMASSVVLEYWYGHFDELGALLDSYHKYGMDSLIVLVHRWQNAGFDRKYPATMPPSASRGGLDTLRRTIAEAQSRGQLIALHENYKDFYPDSPSGIWSTPCSLPRATRSPPGPTQRRWHPPKYFSTPER